LSEEARVSIVITAFNQRHELANSLAGLAVQIEHNQFVPVDIVLVDNGSEPPLDAVLKANRVEVPVRYIWRTPVLRNFRPGSARNIGIGAAKGEFILFLDGDCIPGPWYLRDHRERLRASKEPVVTLGHRIFIDGGGLDATVIRTCRGHLDNMPEVASASNYGLPRDRRLGEFEILDRHPAPFHCCHGCNLGVRRVDIENVGGFDEDFDGYWGYEDIELGYRMWAEGAKFVYVRTAYVYHQEAKASSSRRRAIEARRNYELACEKIPGFRAFRDRLNRRYYTFLAATAEESPPGNAG
jgi:GT2 family glycosyltransferase